MYNTHLTFLLIVLLFNLSSTDNLLKTRKLSDILAADPWDTYDIYVLAVQWGSTLCLTKGDICYEKLKQIPAHSVSLHGLWPSLSSGAYLPDCNSGDAIDIIDTGTETFLKMRQYWPSLTGTNKDFWDHEYNKHGYCYNMKYDIDEEKYDFYFARVLDLFFDLKINTIITDIVGDLEDGEHALPDDFNDKMDQRFGANTYSLRCTKYGGKYYLQEIRFRLDLDLKLTTKGKSQASCPTGQPIIVNYVS
jgi:ribonuclease I